MVQTCQVNWTITISKDTLAIQINRVTATAPTDDATANAIINFNANNDKTAAQVTMTVAGYGYSAAEVLHFWLGFFTACGPFNQFARFATRKHHSRKASLWGIYRRVNKRYYSLSNNCRSFTQPYYSVLVWNPQ
ncbi:MAG: hypothetical protein EZS28_000219 [Streblomastix strix]|uniref:Uncharacterized protein n=1 Tax=Streblomastix strix TaxID=222440 RepID=A0A5J4XAD2_9EUKA|nr:MAG: hypothetical protein EZS28_000219 [Streblomastix strix]